MSVAPTWREIWALNADVLTEVLRHEPRDDSERILVVAQLGNELYRLGHLTDAAACFESVAGYLPPALNTKLFNSLGAVYQAQGRTQAAAAAYQAGLQLPQPDHSSERSQAELGLAFAQLRQGNLDALVTVAPSTTGEAADSQAEQWRLRALAYRDVGQWEEAVSCATLAVEIIGPTLRDPASSVRKGECLFTLAGLLLTTGRPLEALRATADAESSFRDADLLLALPRCQMQRAQILHELDHKGLAIQILSSCIAQQEAAGGESNAALGRATLAVWALLRHDFQGAFENAIKAAESLERNGHLIQAAKAKTIAATAQMGLARNSTIAPSTLEMLDSSRKAVLSALTLLDRQRYLLSRSQTRESWMRTKSFALQVALSAAELVSDWALIAELIETARAQAIPRGADSSAIALTDPLLEDEGTGHQTTDAASTNKTYEAEKPTVAASEAARLAALAALGELHLETPPVVRVRFPSRFNTDLDNDEVVILPELIQAMGIPGTLWWGMWITGDKLWFSLTSSVKVLSAGYLPWQSVAPVLTELMAALPQPQPNESALAAANRATAGALANSPATESALMQRLGDSIVPPELQRQLRERNPLEPLRLLVAPPPELSRVPFALLGMGGNLRLIDRAEVNYVSSASFTSRIVSQRRSSAEVESAIRPVKIAIGDPSFDLPASLDAIRQISSELRLERAKATKKNLLEALPPVPSSPGVIVYAGHAFSGFVGAPATASLCLFGFDPSGVHDDYLLRNGEPPEEWLSARTLLSSDGPRLYDRLLLSGCSTGANPLAEWTGLTPAALWSGANTVVFSHWDLLEIDDHDQPGEIALTNLLQREGDCVRGLREWQLSHLNRWRDSSLSAHGNALVSPLAFAAYGVMSIERSAGKTTHREEE
ncbi:tetratricopeptide (TPR) repeat protein [Arthrobacter sp. B3I9]|uniref:CHAT domain-containing protein n=1 Tax=Arthrobacter sp. B3I9 TaxID=3042270 RepID=UPI00279030CB|nr:CHAT domain-containing protein [Arthrobacter sp. B3I9]MDQ0850683.1 tetratricopeptide (TPR) repeat protein [Arthrobacter sp. B3I9]